MLLFLSIVYFFPMLAILLTWGTLYLFYKDMRNTTPVENMGLLLFTVIPVINLIFFVVILIAIINERK